MKWNRRGHDVEAIAERRRADADAVWESPRPGKRVAIWEEGAHIGTVSVRRIFRLTERTTLANGQHLLLPEITVEVGYHPARGHRCQSGDRAVCRPCHP